jgi:hypothetical protein
MTFLLLVTLTSMVLAGIMSAIAWRMAAEERRRSAARVAALAAEIHGDPRRRPVPAALEDLDIRSTPPPADANGMFAIAAQHSGSRRTVVAAGVLVFGGVVALAILLSGGSNVGARGAAPAPATAAATPRPDPPQPAPLELMALTHEREGDRLIVRGIVRNPSSAAPFTDVAAVVSLFNRDGGFLASGRVTIDPSALRPGEETPFVVTIPGAADAGRYRVSFRTDDRVVPHVDRRGPLQAKLQDHA